MSDDLNARQRLAVTFEPKGALVVVAGPGSGKTKVIVHRIAHLIEAHHAAPSSIMLVTFTNKAAREMQRRVRILVGDARAKEIDMGTFHSMCAGFLRRYGPTVGLRNAFTILDASESKSVIKKTLQSLKMDSFIAVDKAASYISIRKNRIHATNEPPTDLSHVYAEYDARLREDNCVDFDDLLLFGYRLFTQQPGILAHLRHVLIDEFQDTNEVQYEIARALCAGGSSLTVVGDPDQSIYSWRHASVANLTRRLENDFPGCQRVELDTNYRSTHCIVRSSQIMIESEPGRTRRSFGTENAQGIPVSLLGFDDGNEEASFIADEIERLRSAAQGLLNYNDFAVLLRVNAMSRSIEEALSSRGIKYRVVGGLRFFDRADIKNCLAYLRIAANPTDSASCERVINVPPRGIGEATLSALQSVANQRGIPLFEAVKLAAAGRVSIGIRKPSDLQTFVGVIEKLQGMMARNDPLAVILRRLVDQVAYEQYLKTKHKDDAEARWENVLELLSYAEDFERTRQGTSGGERIAQFLDGAVMDSDAATSSEEDDGAKQTKAAKLVTISTMHAAKGLEWPVVFVPGVEMGIIPHKRSLDSPGGEDEERRLLYVAMTRAQAMLYLLTATRRLVGGEWSTRGISKFVSTLVRKGEPLKRDAVYVNSVCNHMPTISVPLLMDLERVLHRNVYATKPPVDVPAFYPPTPAPSLAFVAYDNDHEYENQTRPQHSAKPSATTAAPPRSGRRLLMLFDQDIDFFDGDVPVASETSLGSTSKEDEWPLVAAGAGALSGFRPASSLKRAFSQPSPSPPQSRSPLAPLSVATPFVTARSLSTTPEPWGQPRSHSQPLLADHQQPRTQGSGRTPVKRYKSDIVDTKKLTDYFHRTSSTQ